MTVPSYFQTNTLYCGDCRDVLRRFPEKCADLIYADPPFFSNQQYEVIWGDGYEIRAFEDRWKGGINNYIVWMEERLAECYRVLKDTGSMHLHRDWHAGHYLKVMMDRVFGENNFRNEIVWCYTRPDTKHQKQLPRTHETILWYSKGKSWVFNVDDIRIPYAKSTVERERYSIATSKMTPGIHKRVLPKGGKCPED